MGIFDKDCPLCGSELPVSAEGCACGFSFEPNSIQETAQEQEIAVQDETLYANYLAARVEQTKEAITAAKIVLERDPENPLFLTDLKNAENEYKSACSLHEIQLEKLAVVTEAANSAKKSLEKARAELEREKARAEAAARKEAEEARLRAVARAQIAREAAAREAARKKRIADKQAKQIQKKAEEILGYNIEKKTKQARSAAKAAHERQVAMAMALVSRADDDIKQAKRHTSITSQNNSSNGTINSSAVETTNNKNNLEKKIQSSIVVSRTNGNDLQRPASNVVNVTPEKSDIKPTKAPIIAKKPDLVFKARQAIKAAAAMINKSSIKPAAARPVPENNSRSNKSEPRLPSKGNNLTKQATPEFKALQRRHSDRLLPLPKLVHNAIPTCPHCTAELEKNVKKCKCGFILESSTPDGFELVLTDGDKEAMEAFSYISITKMS